MRWFRRDAQQKSGKVVLPRLSAGDDGYGDQPDGPSKPAKLPLRKRAAAWAKRDALEAKEASLEAWRFVRTHNWKSTAKLVFQRKYWGWWALLVLVIVSSSVLAHYHEQIALAIRPYRLQIRDNKASWLIPTVLLIIVSFPPLFGHELIILVVGLIWGILRGFAIACLGTFVGELATYFAFKYLLRSRAAALESKSLTYACLAQLMREGGWRMVTLVRFSAVPGHVTTAIQSTIGIGVWVFAVACFISLPKQFALVYLGVLLGETQTGLGQLPNPDPGVPSNGSSATDRYNAKHRSISLIVFFVTGAASVIAVYIIWIRMRRIRPRVQAAMEAKRLAESGGLSRVPTMRDDQNHRRASLFLDPSSGPPGESAISLAEAGTTPKPSAEPGSETPESGPLKREHALTKIGSTSSSAANSSLTLPRYSFLPRTRSGTLSTVDAAPSYRSVSRDRSDTFSSKWSNPPHSASPAFPATATFRGRSGTNASSLSSHPLSSPSLPHLPYRDDLTPREEDDYGGRSGTATPSGSQPADYFTARRRRSEPNVADWDVEDEGPEAALAVPEIRVDGSRAPAAADAGGQDVLTPTAGRESSQPSGAMAEASSAFGPPTPS